MRRSPIQSILWERRILSDDDAARGDATLLGAVSTDVETTAPDLGTTLADAQSFSPQSSGALKTHIALPGRYEDLGPIAGGSFGEVRRVRDTVLDRIVALKLLRAERSKDGRFRRRFLNEAQITAQLQHPGIVAVYDRGELADGRLWFTMKEVRGRTLGRVIEELHEVKTRDGFQTAPSGWTFRRLVDAFARICQAMAYAHSRGIVHRDLKPENLMVGEFGEVLVMDWGLARKVGESEPASGPDIHSSPGLTHDGDILGTPAYMSPEQARGATRLHGPSTDVYALGAVLYTLLSGNFPYQDAGGKILAAIMLGPPRPVKEAAVGGPELPEELCTVCEQAMRRDISQRYPSAEAMAQEIVAWLDGVRKREQALAILEQVRSLEPRVAELRTRAEQAQTRARALQETLKPFDPIEKKRPAWALEDQVAQLGQEAAMMETQWLEGVHGALSLDPALPEAHGLLADHYRTRLMEAELSHRAEDAARAEAMLRAHDRGKHAAFLRGDGRLTLVTNPPGARVIVERFVLQDRRLVPVFEQILGPTPLREMALGRGSYLLKIQAPGRVEVRYPVFIDRDGHWDGRAPGESEAFPIDLPRENEIGSNEVYVPAGWTWIGGDPISGDSLPRRRIWIDSFCIGRFPVTTGEYLVFLNDLVKQGREKEALAHCPRAHQALSDAGSELAFSMDSDGYFCLPPDRDGLRWRLDRPVVLVDWHRATSYTEWLSARTGRTYRLLNELEREKAARGVDGRFLAWGDHAEPTFACVAESSPEEAQYESVDGHPTDESVYGVRGLSGNVRDWCINAWRHEGPSIKGERLTLEPTDDVAEFIAIKGGVWSNPISQSRAAARFGGRPNIRRPILGIRIARPWPPIL